MVPSDEERRDYFLQQLEEGNVQEKTTALYELASFNDERSTEAIVKAKCEYAEAEHTFPWEPDRAEWVRVLATSIHDGREKIDIVKGLSNCDSSLSTTQAGLIRGMKSPC